MVPKVTTVLATDAVPTQVCWHDQRLLRGTLNSAATGVNIYIQTKTSKNIPRIRRVLVDMDSRHRRLQRHTNLDQM